MVVRGYYDYEFERDLQNLRTVLVSEITATIATQLKTAIDAALAPFSALLDGVRAAADEQGHRIDGFEHDLCDYSDRIVAFEKTVAHLSSENQKLIDKTDDLESRSRRCNLRVVGIPEKREGGDSVKFMSEFLAVVLGPAIVPAPPKLDRAHRIGPSPVGGDDNSKPRVFIVRFHYYRDKERILQRQRPTTLLRTQGRYDNRFGTKQELRLFLCKPLFGQPTLFTLQMRA
ncbi:hypothetical protein J4Q44_G00023960 [Coregonus suidteri]|uniref:Uncharacterized protein n=1 Tax=Coregonus suidteri TaxID=861788 RepID=A0AAN8R6C3_9TELE